MVKMAKKPQFALMYAAEVKQHLRAIETKYHSLIRAEVETQLLFEPEEETRNRKPSRRPLGSLIHETHSEWVKFHAGTFCSLSHRSIAPSSWSKQRRNDESPDASSGITWAKPGRKTRL